MRRLLKGDKRFYRKVFFVALPIVIQNFITSSLNIVDTIMIGTLGEVEIAAVGIGNQYFFLLNIIMMGIFSGIGIFISQYYGKNDKKSIRKLVGMGLILAVVVGGIFNLLAIAFPREIIGLFNTDQSVIKIGGEYLTIVCFSYIFTAISFNFGISARCVEKTTVPMIASGIALIINTILNYIFIFGAFGIIGMGVKGAAIATLIARVIECIIIIAYIYLTKNIIAGSLKEFMDFDKAFAKTVGITVLPVLLNEACWGFGSIMYNIIYGRIGTSAIAAVQIATTVSNLFMVVIFGLASASLVIVGKEVGSGNRERAIEYGNNSLRLGCIIGVGLSILIILLSGKIVGMYNVSIEVQNWAKWILYVIALVMVIRVYNVIAIVGVLRGGGDTTKSFHIEASTMWGIGVPAAFLGAFVFNLPVVVVYALCGLEELVKMVLCIKRIRGTKWIKSLVEEDLEEVSVNL